MTSGTWILMWSRLTSIGWPQKVSYSTEIMLNPFVHLLELPLCPGSIHTKWEDKYVFEIVNISVSLNFEIEEWLFYILPYLERFLSWFSDQIRVGFKPLWSVIIWYLIKQDRRYSDSKARNGQKLRQKISSKIRQKNSS